MTVRKQPKRKHCTPFPALFLLLYILTSCTTLNNDSTDPVPPPVRQFLDKNGWDLNRYALSNLDDLTVYQEHFRYYSVPVNPEMLWTVYTGIDPREVWQGGIINFGLMYSPGENRMYFKNDLSIPGFQPGQIYLLELKLAGFYKLPAAFKINRIKFQTFQIEFIYLKENRSNGIQQIRFYPFRNKEGMSSTLIEHRSWYTSGNKFRDTILYPPFHTQTVDEFHKNVTESAGLKMEILSMDEAGRIRVAGI